MKKTSLKIAALLLTLCMVLPLAACGEKPASQGENTPGGNTGTNQAAGVQAADLFHTLLTTVKYDQPLTDLSISAEFTYMGLPADAKIVMYQFTSGSCKDELTWIRVAKASDVETAKSVVEAHLEEVAYDAERYYPAEEPKVVAAQTWYSGNDIILCITNDYENVKSILADASKVQKKPDDVTYGSMTEQPAVTEPTEDSTQPHTTEPDETDPPATEPPVVGYPKLTSQSGTWRDGGNAMIVDNMAYEYYSYDANRASKYASLVSKAANQLQGQTDVYCMVIPTSIGVVLPDDIIPQYSGYEDQCARLEEIYGMMDSSVKVVNIYDKLMQHRDEYLYYRTDWHWSGIGAYYGYERFCEVKGVEPYTMDQRRSHAYEGYLGPFAGKSSSLSATPDTVYAYEPFFDEQVSMVFTDTNGNDISWPVIADGDSYGASGKYLIFAAGDQPIAEFTNEGVTDGSVAIVVKESFGNALMSYVVDHYSTVYEIDYRHWNGNLVEFAREVGADDLIFANNIGMVRSGDRIAELSRLIP